MLAQFVGLPGAGKTSLVEALTERSPDLYLRVPQNRSSAAMLFRARPIRSAVVFLHVLPVVMLALTEKSGGPRLSDRWAPMATLFAMLVQYDEIVALSEQGKTVVYDEFVLQRILGIFASGTHKPSLAKIRFALAWLKAYQATPLFLETGPDEAAARVESRPSGWPRRWRGLEAADRESVLVQQSQLMDALYVLSHDAHWIDASGSFEQTRLATRESLEEHRTQPTVATPPSTVAHFVFNQTGYGGAGQQAVALIRNMPTVRAVVFNVERDTHRTGVSRLPNGDLRIVHLPKNPLAAIVAIAEFAWTHRISVFHLHGFVRAGLVSGWLLRKRLILKTTLLGGDDLHTISRRQFGWAELALARRVHLNVCLSNALAEINRGYLSADRVIHLPNGVDCRSQVPTAPTTERSPVFCTVGLFCERKRTHVAIEKFLAAATQYPETAKLYVVGPTGEDGRLDEGDRAYFARCKALVPASRREQVRFTGSLKPGELKAIYAESLGILFFSEREGLPNVLLEAMAFNCVPITSEISGVAREVIPSLREGFVIEDDQPIPSLDDLIACSAAGGPRRRIEEAFDLGSLAERYAALYVMLMEGRPSAVLGARSC